MPPSASINPAVITAIITDKLFTYKYPLEDLQANANSTTTSPTSSSKTLNQTDLIIIPIFSFLGLCLILTALWICLRRRRAKARRLAQEKDAALIEPQLARAPSSTYPSELASPHHMTELPDHQLDFLIPPVPMRYVEPVDHPLEMSADQYLHEHHPALDENGAPLPDQELEGDMPRPLAPSSRDNSSLHRAEAGGLASHPPAIPQTSDAGSYRGAPLYGENRSQMGLSQNRSQMGLGGGDNRSQIVQSEHRSQMGHGDNRSQMGLDAASVATGSYHGSEWEDDEVLDVGGGEGGRRPPPMIVHERNATDREGRHDAVSTRSVSPLGGGR